MIDEKRNGSWQPAEPPVCEEPCGGEKTVKQPLATLSFESLQRRWPALTRRQVEAIRNEEQLIAVIAASSTDDVATIKRKLREARKETLLSLPLAALSPLKGPAPGHRGPATESQPAM